MKLIIPNLYIGTVEDVPNLLLPPYNWKLANVCKTLHLPITGSTDETIKTKNSYVFYEDPLIISLNWVDAAAKYFDYKNMGVINVNKVLRFIHENLEKYNILITCDQAQSRSPSIAMLYLAKEGLIANDSFEFAAIEFYNRYYAGYNPGEGIQEFLKTNWHDFHI